MPQQVQSVAIYSNTTFTGETTTPEVIVPAGFGTAYIDVILSAPISPLNIFDITVLIEVSDDGGQTWRVQDRTEHFRDLIEGPLTAITLSSSARITGVDGKRLRARLSCGQSVLAASIVVNRA